MSETHWLTSTDEDEKEFTDDRTLTEVRVMVSHPTDWELDDIADELFEWSEGLEDTRLIIHTVSGDQGPAGTPDDDDHDDGDDFLLVESDAGSLEEFQAEMSALREYAETLYEKEQDYWVTPGHGSTTGAGHTTLATTTLSLRSASPDGWRPSCCAIWSGPSQCLDLPLWRSSPSWRTWEPSMVTLRSCVTLPSLCTFATRW